LRLDVRTVLRARGEIRHLLLPVVVAAADTGKRKGCPCRFLADGGFLPLSLIRGGARSYPPLRSPSG
jgi:hypothetical protein